MAWLALLAVIGSGFISVRNAIRENTIMITKVSAEVGTLHEFCCGEIESK